MKHILAHRITVLALTAAVMCSAAACSGPSLGATEQPQGEPTFSGPWAEDFQLSYDQARENDNTFAQDVLRDEQITEAEATEVASRYQSCMADAGFVYDYVNPDGSAQMPTDNMSDAEQQRLNEQDIICSKQSGQYFITALYNALVQDPNGELRNRTAEEIRQDLTECLKRKGAVGPEFTAEDIPIVDADGEEYTQFNQQFTNPGGKYYSEQNYESWIQCNDDPRK
ncbi:hypothetical protein BLI708_08340 [Bifidobacterium imperatoris]|uniref:Lipoprotein n=1 Tax=Bifidobacterium imperatoris TaxID=2020965 RepID=A0A2N5IUS7_9BIFI|nr:hypothetical protein [Bifidobacterium imperatoris]PLS25688.1 hypothetical protein Tam1G_0512 [Bifidobacterium imperatoris]QSY57240.1 hypothetical protein BLI708_08340 [Bifidobacterium imperatoris]